MSGEFGQPRPRADGALKVTGQARYAAEVSPPGVAYAVLVPSEIGKGHVRRLDTSAAGALPGVLAVLTPGSMPRLTPAPVAIANQGTVPGGVAGQQFLPLQGDEIFYAGQPIALVVAETLEEATEAAMLVRAEYAGERPQADFDAALAACTFTPVNGWPEPAETTRGDLDAGRRAADVRVDVTYDTALQHHVTLEPHSTVAQWDGDHLTVHEPSTWVYGVRKALATWLSIPEDSVRAMAPFVGGSFGAKGPTWPHAAFAAVAARHVGRPVKLVLTRPQTFWSNGYRPHLRHHLRLGARRDGTLTALAHGAEAHTAPFDDRIVAPVTKTSPKVYACPNVQTSYRMAHLNLCGPFTFRGPGETPGLFALECAMDELAWALGMDPIALRLKNYAGADPENGKPWSSKSLRECYRQGAERFGWDRRVPQVRATRDGDWWVGMGMATMMYDAKSAPTSARARLSGDGQVVVQSATCDQGTGSYTIMPQIAADALGVPAARVRFELGDTDFPLAPISAGSQTAASVGSAVQAAARSLRAKLLSLAFADLVSPLHGLTEDDVTVQDGRISVQSDPGRGENFADIAKRQAGEAVEVTEKINAGEAGQDYSRYSFGAHFSEVRVHADTGEARVARHLGVFGAGRIVNARTAHSQLIGGIIWGIGQALMEETHLDTHFGRIVNAGLDEYLVPVNADIGDIDGFFVEEEDPHVNPLGVKGVGEIGTIGAAAAIANAVYHATGKRIRRLPITPDKVM